MTSPTTPVATGERLHALDSLRATAMLLGILLHAAVAFSFLPIPWPVHDVSRSRGFDAMMGFIHGFRMQVFFFLAGFFGHLVWRRLGTRGFMRQRATRIGLPFIGGMLVLIPLFVVIWTWADSLTGSTYVADQSRRERGLLDLPTLHLWFLEMLLILYVAAMALAQLGRSPAVAARLDAIDAAFDRLMRQPLKPLLLAVPTTGMLWFGPRLMEIDDAGVRLVPGVQAVAYYGLFFAVGWWLHRRLHLLDTLRDHLVHYFAAAVLSFLVAGGAFRVAQAPGAAEHWLAIKSVGMGAWALFSWTMTFAVTGCFLRYAGTHRPWARYMADASYWWYLIHLPVVMVVQVLIRDWPVNGWLKWLLVLALTAAVLAPSYHWLVRYTWLGRILNGPRERTAADQPTRIFPSRT